MTPSPDKQQEPAADPTSSSTVQEEGLKEEDPTMTETSSSYHSNGSTSNNKQQRGRRTRCIAFWQTLTLLLLHKQLTTGGATGGGTTATAAAAAVNNIDQQQRHSAAATTTKGELQKSPSDLHISEDSYDDDDDDGEEGWDNDSDVDGDGLEEYDLQDNHVHSDDPAPDVSAYLETLVEEVNDEDDAVIVISTADGTMAGLSRATGETLWKRPPAQKQSPPSSSMRMREPQRRPQNYPSDHDGDDDDRRISEAPPLTLLTEPLVQTTTTVGRRDRWRTAAVPSLLDGKVYLTAASSSSSRIDNIEEEETVAASIRNLVERAPFVDSRGRMYTASKETTVVAVQVETGEMVRELGRGETIRFDDDDRGSEGKNVVWMGRVDYQVSIHEPQNGELDVQFSISDLMSVNDMMLLTSGEDDDGASAEGRHHQQLLLSSSSSSLSQEEHGEQQQQHRHHHKFRPRQQVVIATPSGHVAYRDPVTGKIAWVANESFETPVAFALDSDTGTSLKVDIVPDAVVPHGSSEYVSKEMQRQLELLGERQGSSDSDDVDSDETIVGSLPNTGQLYAMPLGKTQAPNEIQTHTHRASSSAAMRPPKHAAIAGRQQHPAAKLYHHEAGNHQHQHHHGKCSPGSPSFPRCLAGDSHDNWGKQQPHTANFLADYSTAHGVDHDGAIVPFFHPEYGYHYIPPEHFYTIQHHSHQHHRRSSYTKALKILGSWLPPVMLILFVSSWEMGRRKRLKDIVAEVDSSKATVSTDKEQNEDEKGDSNGGIIQVYDDVILGHGGHGTVVYKGELDGRQVAVKRMLKTYHASADREISLLIESDGHPNVVRYFLKEMRGDFVYLALELCDLSLHDLIGSIRMRLDSLSSEQEEGSSAAEAQRLLSASKAILIQIVKGVSHLHQLRIVHRDLKPANILLADSRKNKLRVGSVPVYEIFENGDYVAKISDMGLGKQLVGQSSYGGGSLMNDSSLRGQSNGQSSIIGVGPGSVGWQAPEVMALRMPADTSVKSDASSGSIGASSELSPVDISPGARTSRSVDIFSLGCIFYSTLVPGSHPFGDWYEREANIMHNRPNIAALEDVSQDAYDLVQAMLQRKASNRPTAKQICDHPFFWSSERRLAFLCDFSDRLENDFGVAEDTASSSSMTKLLMVERNASCVFGTSWDGSLHEELFSNVQKFRSYDPSSVRDLLRLIRNKYHHFDELSESLKESIGCKSEGLMGYFDAKFPRLIMHCYHASQELYDSNDPLVVKYSIAPAGKPKESDRASKKSINNTSPRKKLHDENVSLAEKNNDSNPLTELDNDATSQPLAAALRTDDEACSGAKELSDPMELMLPTVPEQGAFCVSRDVSSSIGTATDADDEQHSHDDQEAYTDLVIWQGSTAADAFQCRGWHRSDEEWERRTVKIPPRRRDELTRSAEDAKYRTRLCNHWDVSLGTSCPMRKKSKCIFAHGPVELRVKEGKRNRWGKLVDRMGNNKNPSHSGGEDTYGAARSIEAERKQEGKWNTNTKKKKTGNGRAPLRKNNKIEVST